MHTYTHANTQTYVDTCRATLVTAIDTKAGLVATYETFLPINEDKVRACVSEG